MKESTKDHFRALSNFGVNVKFTVDEYKKFFNSNRAKNYKNAESVFTEWLRRSEYIEHTKVGKHYIFSRKDIELPIIDTKIEAEPQKEMNPLIQIARQLERIANALETDDILIERRKN